MTGAKRARRISGDGKEAGHPFAAFAGGAGHRGAPFIPRRRRKSQIQPFTVRRPPGAPADQARSAVHLGDGGPGFR